MRIRKSLHDRLLTWKLSGGVRQTAAGIRERGGLLVVTVCMVVGNLLADIAYAWIDPRIRLTSRA